MAWYGTSAYFQGLDGLALAEVRLPVGPLGLCVVRIEHVLHRRVQLHLRLDHVKLVASANDSDDVDVGWQVRGPVKDE
jgi:hypothetical protein